MVHIAEEGKDSDVGKAVAFLSDLFLPSSAICSCLPR